MGRLADNRRQLEKMTRTAGEDPSIFAIALETLAVKAFGDMGQTARLRLIRDLGVWESHADPEIRRVSKPGPSDSGSAILVDPGGVFPSSDPEPGGTLLPGEGRTRIGSTYSDR